MDQDELVNKRVARIARDHGCTVDQVDTALDHHPIELDRDRYLKRTLALELLRLANSRKPLLAGLSMIVTSPLGCSWAFNWPLDALFRLWLCRCPDR
jgi:hypothetical protein